MRQIIADFGMLQIGGLSIPLRVFAYGLMLVLGFFCGILLARWRARRNGESPEMIANCGIFALLGGVVGARIAYVIRDWDQFQKPDGGLDLAAVLDVTSGGLIYFGGLAGGFAAVLAYLAIKRAPIRRMADIIAPSLMLGLAFGRAGCLLNGCCWGGPCDPNWAPAMQFPMISQPLIRSGPEPYSPDQGLCPTYAHQYWQGRVHPDARLLNQYVSREVDTPDGQTLALAAPIPPGQLHGALTTDQLAPAEQPVAEARQAFDAIAGADGLVSRAEWDAARADGTGLLRGSEVWDGAITFSSPGVEGPSTVPSLTFQELWTYLQHRRSQMTLRFDGPEPDGQLDASERAAANAWLQEDLYAVLASQRSLPVRPAQVLGILNGLLLCGILLAFGRHRRREGRVLALMLMLYPATRFVLESLRHDDLLNLVHGDWTYNQIAAIPMTLAGLGLWIWISRLPASAGPVWSQRRLGATDSTGRTAQ